MARQLAASSNWDEGLLLELKVAALCMHDAHLSKRHTRKFLHSGCFLSCSPQPTATKHELSLIKAQVCPQGAPALPALCDPSLRASQACVLVSGDLFTPHNCAGNG